MEVPLGTSGGIAAKVVAKSRFPPGLIGFGTELRVRVFLPRRILGHIAFDERT
jgi:hypothetical protein